MQGSVPACVRFLFFVRHAVDSSEKCACSACVSTSNACEYYTHKCIVRSMHVITFTIQGKHSQVMCLQRSPVLQLGSLGTRLEHFLHVQHKGDVQDFTIACEEVTDLCAARRSCMHNALNIYVQVYLCTNIFMYKWMHSAKKRSPPYAALHGNPFNSRCIFNCYQTYKSKHKGLFVIIWYPIAFFPINESAWRSPQWATLAWGWFDRASTVLLFVLTCNLKEKVVSTCLFQSTCIGFTSTCSEQQEHTCFKIKSLHENAYETRPYSTNVLSTSHCFNREIAIPVPARTSWKPASPGKPVTKTA